MNQNPILNSLPAIFSSIEVQAVEGLGVFYAVYKFFKTIDENLNAEAAAEIANWILGSGGADQGKTWPDFFATIFGRIFGTKQLSWTCIGRSGFITCMSMALIAPWVVLSRGTRPDKDFILFVVPTQILASVVPDYFCILITRTCISIMRRYRSILFAVILLLIATCLSYLLSVSTPFAADEIEKLLRRGSIGSAEPFAGLKRGIDVMIGALWASVFASLASSIWLWLFVLSGLLLRGARVFRLGFHQFSKAFDIRKKPLACLGLVAGAGCALCWWCYIALIHIKGG